MKISLELGKEYEIKHMAIGKVFMVYSPHLSNSVYNGINENESKIQENEMQGILGVMT